MDSKGNIPYDEVCRVIGHLYLDCQSQLRELSMSTQDSHKELFSLRSQVAGLQAELNRQISEK